MNKIIAIILLLISLISSIVSYRCGFSERSLRIIGGKDAVKLRWPWMVRLKIRLTLETGNIGVIYCGGVLINEQWVITAAHCLRKPSIGQVISVKAIIGANNITKKEKGQLELNATKLIIHGKYTGDEPFEHDIGMVKLETALDFDGEHNYLAPICLPSTFLQVDNDRCYATGWGKTSDNKYPEVLQEVRMPLLSDDTCFSAWNSTYSYNKVCAGSMNGGINTCNGDSGGPLQCPLLNGVWVLKGITSFGSGSEDGYPICDVKGQPGVFTRVDKHLRWINKNLGNIDLIDLFF